MSEIEASLTPNGHSKEESDEAEEKVQDQDENMQLRIWKERSSRMEILLAKKSAKIQEMEETEVKLKRLLAMAKRSIDNSKQELTEKDSVIEKLQEEAQNSQVNLSSENMNLEPRRIHHKVTVGSISWLLVEYARDGELQDAGDLQWLKFKSEGEIKDFVQKASGEPITVPEISLSPYEVDKVKKDLKVLIDHTQEEFRRYRVRAEITRKQKDAELKKMNANIIARHQEQILESDTATELRSARMQIRRLTKAQAEGEERESEWRRKYEKLIKDYEKLSGTMGETVLATEWRERFEQAVREKEEMQKMVEEIKSIRAVESQDSTRGSDFTAYRKRVLNAVEEKEQESNDLHSQYQDSFAARLNGVTSTRNTSSATLRRMSSSSSLGGFDAPHATTTNEYLKNIVFKYMVTDQPEAKEHMEKAIATVLNFTPSELSSIQEKKKQQGWFW